ncbi:MAG: adenylate/guanylate cyclase domain-containing protein [Verrucomicrobiota bacterium]
MTRLLIFNLAFIGLNLLFIPLMSLYGLRVCPTLNTSGFSIGCAYSGTFISVVCAVNLLLTTLHPKKANTRISKTNGGTFFGLYIIATLIALLTLELLFRINHISHLSRAPEVLVLASVLLAITQYYGLSWAMPAPASITQEFKSDQKQSSFRRLWLGHLARTTAPIIVSVILLLHFLLRQSDSMNHGHVAPTMSPDQLINGTGLLIGFTMIWLTVTFTFHFLSENDQTTQVERHLSRLKDLDLSFRSETNLTWGLWKAILSQLNEFSKIFGERMRLLKSFSRFVTASVAQDAAENELKQAIGVGRELTVIMSDIRDFTSISESLHPQQVVKLLNEYFSAMLDEMAQYSVNVDKFIGDGILAYVDSDSQENQESTKSAHLENMQATLAALAMLKRVKLLNLSLIKMNIPEIKIGIGIIRGPLVIGLIGSESKLQHTIIGDTVNRAARLEGLCKELSVQMVLSKEVWLSLPLDLQINFSAMGSQKIKGIREEVEVYGGPRTDTFS